MSLALLDLWPCPSSLRPAFPGFSLVWCLLRRSYRALITGLGPPDPRMTSRQNPSLSPQRPYFQRRSPSRPRGLGLNVSLGATIQPRAAAWPQTIAKTPVPEATLFPPCPSRAAHVTEDAPRPRETLRSRFKNDASLSARPHDALSHLGDRPSRQARQDGDPGKGSGPVQRPRPALPCPTSPHLTRLEECPLATRAGGERKRGAFSASRPSPPRSHPCRLLWSESSCPAAEMAPGGWDSGVIRSRGWGRRAWGQCPYKRDPRVPLSLTVREDTAVNSEAAAPDANSAGTLTLGFPAPGTVRNAPLWFINRPACGDLLQQPPQAVATPHRGRGRKEGARRRVQEAPRLWG